MPTAKQFKIGDVVKLTNKSQFPINCPKKLEAFKDGDFFVMECLDGDKSITVRPFGEQKILGPFFSWRFDLVKKAQVEPKSPWPIGRYIQVTSNYPANKQFVGMIGRIVNVSVGTITTYSIQWISPAPPKLYVPVYYWQEAWMELLPEDFVVPNYGGDVPVDDETFAQGLDAADTLEAMAPVPVPNNGPIMWKYNPDTKEKTLIDPATLPKPDEWQVGDFALIIEGGYKGWIAPVVDLHPQNKNVVRLQIKGTKGFNETVWYEKSQLTKVPKPFSVENVSEMPSYIIIRICPNGKAIGSPMPKIYESFSDAYDESKKLALENPGHKFRVMRSLECVMAIMEGVDVTPVPAEV
jgi:hypothetical protein